MKNLKLFAVLLTIMSFSFLQANPVLNVNDKSSSFITNEDPKPVVLTEEIRQEIINLMDYHEIDHDKDLIARVVFTLNKKNEIVVLYVLTDNRDVDHYIKQKLNYKKININVTQDGLIYHLPIKLEKDSS